MFCVISVVEDHVDNGACLCLRLGPLGTKRKLYPHGYLAAECCRGLSVSGILSNIPPTSPINFATLFADTPARSLACDHPSSWHGNGPSMMVPDDGW